MQAKEKISDAARQTSEEGFFNPSTLEQVFIHLYFKFFERAKMFFNGYNWISLRLKLVERPKRQGIAFKKLLGP